MSGGGNSSRRAGLDKARFEPVLCVRSPHIILHSRGRSSQGVTAMELRVISRDADAVHGGCRRDPAGSVAGNPDPVRSLLDERGYATAVVIGLGGVTFMDSSGIGWLLKCHKRAREAGGRFVVHSLPPGVMDVMKMMRLDKVLQIAENESASLSMLEGVKP